MPLTAAFAGVLDGNLALGQLDEDDEGDDQDECQDVNSELERAFDEFIRAVSHILFDPLAISGGDLNWKIADDTGEDDDGNTVSKAFGGDLVTEPHRQHRSGEDDGDNIGISPEIEFHVDGDILAVLHRFDDAIGLNSS